jgi:hypothetical protein
MGGEDDLTAIVQGTEHIRKEPGLVSQIVLIARGGDARIVAWHGYHLSNRCKVGNFPTQANLKTSFVGDFVAANDADLISQRLTAKNGEFGMLVLFRQLIVPKAFFQGGKGLDFKIVSHNSASFQKKFYSFYHTHYITLFYKKQAKKQSFRK